MEATTTDLKNQCKNIEFRIEAEKFRLQSLQGVLEQCQVTKDIEKERECNNARFKEIELCEEKITELSNEFNNLRNSLTEIEKERTEVIAPAIEKQKRSVNQMTAEIDTLDVDIRKIEKQILKVREVNNWMEYENRRKLEECVGTPPCVKELQFGRLRMQEEEARLAVERLKENAKKLNNQLMFLREILFTVQRQCWEEQVKLNEIQNDLSEFKRMEERMKAERMLSSESIN